MNKLKRGRKLSRTRDQRHALLKILAGNLVLHEKIKTTRAKAKELTPFIEKAITKAKKGGLANTRLLRRIFTEKATAKLIKDLALRYKERHGGFVRITGLGGRLSDSAQMVIIEFVK